ncbi:MAG TPA: carboxypeptidase-like regulatory domain-containing protein, partial [Thermoanaerobaculia bacterium]|nr:carboxypeptidase-like regulatory domain-containing protein [Thermoanaerobaculia bacterium]
VARLEGLAPGERLKLRVEAPGFLPAEATLSPPWPDPAVVTLERGLSVTGVYADASGVPVADGNVRIETGSSFRDDSLDPGGGFELLLEPTVDHVLVLASPHTPESRVRVPAGQAGEHRDLGPILAAPGLVAYGRIVSAADGLPLGGARIWTPRVRRHGAVAAWAFGDVVEAKSDATGDFAVTGLDRRVHELVVEVPGHARRYVEVRPEEGEDAVDLGNVEISPGATVAVDVDPHLGEAAEHLEARLDLRGDWRDLDMLFAPVVDGRAEFVHVPAGRSLLTVRVGHEIVCERSVVVTDDEPVEVACDRARDDVAGQVWVGDQLASRGVLTWRPPPAGDAGAVIFNRSSPRGARQQRAVGVGRLPVVVEVVDDGSFRSDRLVAGRWQVSWQADGGEPFVPLTVDVPTGGVAGLDLRFDGVVVSGWVLDEDEEPVAGAVVGEVGGGATVLSGEDGGFRLAGLDAGSLSLQARWRDRYSEVAEVVVEADRPPQPVELRVRRRHGGLVPVEVWTAAGAPARGAFVFFEADPGASTRVVSADLDGRAELAYPEPVPERVRVAVHVDGRWVLGDWVALDEATDGLVLEVPATG